MSIDPSSGLRAICGPSTDKEFVTRSIAKSVVSKQSRSVPVPGGIRNGDQGRLSRVGRNKTPSQMAKQKRTATSSRTGRSPRPSSSLVQDPGRDTSPVPRFGQDRSPAHVPGSPRGRRPTGRRSFTTPTGDVLLPRQRGDIDTRQSFSWTRSITPAGLSRRAALSFSWSTRQARGWGRAVRHRANESLQMLANESGGLYFEGADKDIIQALADDRAGLFSSCPFRPCRKCLKPGVDHRDPPEGSRDHSGQRLLPGPIAAVRRDDPPGKAGRHPERPDRRTRGRHRPERQPDSRWTSRARRTRPSSPPGCLAISLSPNGTSIKSGETPAKTKSRSKKSMS